MLEMDAHGYLTDERICEYWAKKSFGCSGGCKSVMAVHNDTRLHALSLYMPPGRPKSGRIALCPSKLQLGSSITSSGVTYTVDAGVFWTAQDDQKGGAAIDVVD